MQMHKINSGKVKQRLSLISTESDHRVWGPQALLIWGESSSLCFLSKKTRVWGSCVWQQKAAYFMPAVLALDTHLEWTDLIKFFSSWTHLRSKLSNASTSSVFYEMHDALVPWKGSGVVETLTPSSELCYPSWWKTQNQPRQKVLLPELGCIMLMRMEYSVNSALA